MKYKPWSGNSSNAWGGGPGTDASCIEAYHSFIFLPIAADYIPHFTHELDRAQQHIAEDTCCDNEREEPTGSEEHDWMLLCQLNPHSSRMPPHMRIQSTGQKQHKPFPLSCSENAHHGSNLRKHAEANGTLHSPWHRQLPPIDISTLNMQQRTAYDIVHHHHELLIDGSNPAPLHMIVYGIAGTGKSYLISAIAHVLGSACLLTGTTGMAAIYICGKTIHSALQLPIDSGYRDLQGSSQQHLQLALQDRSYNIIDEMSMIEQRMLAWIDKCLHQATGQLDTSLGGLSLILFGDFGQFPLVGDTPL